MMASTHEVVSRALVDDFFAFRNNGRVNFFIANLQLNQVQKETRHETFGVAFHAAGVDDFLWKKQPHDCPLLHGNNKSTVSICGLSSFTWLTASLSHYCSNTLCDGGILLD